MFARLLRMQTTVERINEAAKLFEESVIPLCRNQKGYKGAYFLTDRKTGVSIPVTLWENEKDMLDTESSHFFQEQLVKFMGLFKAPPIRETFEVIVQD
jgi:hypothetical protein